MSVFTGGPYGRLAVMLNTLSSLNIENIIIIIIIIISLIPLYVSNRKEGVWHNVKLAWPLWMEHGQFLCFDNAIGDQLHDLETINNL